jgi:hypothetical protein
MWTNYAFPRSFIDDFTRHYHFPLNQVYFIVFIAIFITFVRYVFEKIICKVRSSPAVAFVGSILISLLATGQLA